MSSPQAAALRQAIEAQARRLGFQLFGVTTPDPPPHFAAYEHWLQAGFHGQMAYLADERARQRRAEPGRILPECRSILVLGMRYPSPESLAEEPRLVGNPRGRVAAYAWGEDYHDVLVERLQALVAFIEAQVGGPVPNRCYTDTGPLLERDLAQRAGLGWAGKNTCLVHPRQGSCFFLAEILLGLPLPPDPPFTHDRCGSCQRCLQACPAGCILPDRTIDSRHCISYLTIELKGPIPHELRPMIGEWVFGCDICQQVCPWNQRFARLENEAGIDPAFAPRPGLPRPDLVEELSLTPEAFNQKFKGSPLKRARRRGYLRNVAVALGNRGDPAALPALAQALTTDPEPLVRGHAAWALGRIGGETARQALYQAAQSETDAYVREEIQIAQAISG
ncbi:MAG: tRNA epoxyqueuosine(34) reductase QueG [Anaerolineales bacterium]|nr:tRNA epoxyqueuosine(34) reductase QueG [Anaerolineales bacterium]